MKWLKKALGRTGRKVAEEHVTRGYIAAHEGRHDQALKHYNDAIDADDTLAVAFFNAGQTELERFNRDVAALDDEQRAARLKTAADLLDRGLALEATHAPSWRTLARVRERQGAARAAVAAWSSVVAYVDGDNAAVEGAEARREIKRLTPAADLEAAVAAAHAAFADNDLDVAARSAAVDALLATWDRVELDGVREPPRLFTLAGSLARKAGDARARDLLETAVARDKHDLDAWKDLATICLAVGDLKAALNASMAAFREDPVDAGLVCNVGVCHLAAGDLDKAAEFHRPRRWHGRRRPDRCSCCGGAQSRPLKVVP